MSGALRILHLEDDPKDAEIIQGVLETGGIGCNVTRVDTRDDFIASLDAAGFDLILADFSLPLFDGMSALKIAHEKRPDIPFIFVSGTLGEEVAIDALKIGATDYVLKERLSRIVNSVQRALREARERTERERLYADLRESEQKYRTLFESIDEGFCTIEVVFDENAKPVDYRFLQVNPSFERQTGIKNAVGRRMREIAPGHEEHWFETYGKIALTGEPMRFENEARQLGRWYDVYAFRLEDPKLRRVGILFNDITERKQAEAELRKEKAYLDQLFDLAPIAIILDSLEPRTLRVNKEFSRMFGYAPDEVVGKRIRDLIVPQGERAITDDPRWRAGERVETDVVRRHKDGTLFHAHVTAAHIPFKDAAGAGYVIYHDITERKRAEAALRESEQQLRQAQRFEAMGTLAGGIAHDFNNILGAILGYGERALRDAAKASRLRADLDSIMAAGERGRALVDRILEFSRGGASERVAVNVERVVREAVDLLEGKLPEGIKVVAELNAGRAAIMGDPTQVHQVVMNLGTNAIQAMPAGGTLAVSLEVARFDAERAATIGVVGRGEWLVLRVADSGCGIAPEIIERIFDPFFTTKEAGVGSGLGLSLVLRLVTEAGGAIDVASTPGAGSTFTVYLPRAGEANDSSDDEEPALPRGEGQRVLVVDDEEPLVALATRTLEELGYEPVAFTSSVAALAAFRADPQRFDAVITDERMPGITGVELIRQIRSLRPTIPILLVSGYVGGAVASRAYDEGADDVLKKPLSASELGANLARVLRQ